MDINRFTEKVQQALHGAQRLATRFGHQQVDVEHLLERASSQQVLYRDVAHRKEHFRRCFIVEKTRTASTGLSSVAADALADEAKRWARKKRAAGR